jgi:hypothetical protein
VRSRVRLIFLLAFGILAVSALPARAQAIPPPPPKPATPAPATTPTSHAIDVAIGYSFLREAGIAGAPANIYPYGWLTSVGVRLGSSPLKAVGELTANYRHEAGELWTLWGYLGGIRYDVIRVGKMDVFAQGLVGWENFRVTGFSDHGFAVQPGGGIDVPIGGSIKGRAQADYRYAHYTDDGTNFHEFRFAASVVFGFK